MRRLGIDELENEQIVQREHLYGPSNKRLKMICDLLVLFVSSRKNKDKPLKFDVQSNVIDENLPILIGLPTLLAIKASLNFQITNLSVVIDLVVYRVQLVKRSSYSGLTFGFSVTHQRSLRDYDGSCDEVGNTRANFHRQNAQENYYTPIAKNTLHLLKEPKLLTLSNLEKISEQFGHATGTQMITFILESQIWDASYSDLIDKLILLWSWSIAAAPTPHSVYTANPAPERNQTNYELTLFMLTRSRSCLS